MPAAVIVRLPNWLGDTVMAVPAVRALRHALRGSPLVLAGPWAPLLAGQDLAETLVPYPRRWRGRLAAAGPLRKLAPEMAVLLPNSLESAVAALCWGARRRVGLATQGRSWLLTDPVPPPSPTGHQIDEYLALAGWLEAPVVDPVPRLAPPPADGAPGRRVDELLASVGVRGDRAVGVHLGAAFGPARTWPPGRVAELAAGLRREGRTVLLLGPAADHAAAEQVRRTTRVPSLVGRDTPALLPALLARLSALVCGDTGVGHLAAALGTPVVALFGPTDWRRSAPRGRVEVVRRPAPCAPCVYRACPIEHPCMRDITAGDVLVRVRALLATAPSAVPGSP